MITEFFVQLGTSISQFFAGLFGNTELPSWATNALVPLFSFLDSANGLSGWFPWAFLGGVLAFLVTVFGIIFAIKLLMKVWSMIPIVGGGS